MFIAVLIIVFLATRILNLTLLPVFADEAIYIHWAQIIWHDAGNRFIPLSDGKPPLFMWLLVPFLKVIADPLTAGRMLSVFSGLATLAGVYFLSNKLFSKKVAVLASFFVIFQPFMLFYDRMALVDSLLTAFGVWSFYLAYLLFKNPRLDLGILLGTLWGGAVLTKPTGIYFPFLTPPMLLIFPLKKWLEKIKKLLAPSVLAVGYALGFINILRLSPASHMLGSRTGDYLRTWNDFATQGHEYIPDTAGVLFFWLIDYFSWFAFAIFAVSLFLAFLKKEKKISLMFLWAFAPFVIQVFIGKIIYPRYLLTTAPFLLIIIAWGITQKLLLLQAKGMGFLSLNLRNRKDKIGIIMLLITGAMLVSWGYFDFKLLTNPAKASLGKTEKEQYLYEWSAGYGIREIAGYLKSLPKDRAVIAATEGYFGTLPNGLQIYLDQVKNIDIRGVGQPIHFMPDELVLSKIEGREGYLIVNNTRMFIEDLSGLELIAEYPKPEGPKGVEKLLFFKVK